MVEKLYETPVMEEIEIKVEDVMMDSAEIEVPSDELFGSGS